MAHQKPKSTNDHNSYNKATQQTNEAFAGASEYAARKAARKLGPRAIERSTTLADEDIANTAADITRQLLEKNPNHPHLDAMSLIAVMPSTIEAVSSERKTEQEKDALIEYNNVLKGIIDRNPSATPNDVLNLVVATAFNYNRRGRAITDLSSETEGRLQGMRHELALESVLLNLPEDYTYKAGDGEDDKHGGDYIVTAPNGKKVRIDVKASIKKAEKAIADEAAYFKEKGQPVPEDHIIAASGFEDSDFIPGSPWRPTYEASVALVDGWKEFIDDAAGMPPQDPHVKSLQ